MWIISCIINSDNFVFSINKIYDIYIKGMSAAPQLLTEKRKTAKKRQMENDYLLLLLFIFDLV